MHTELLMESEPRSEQNSCRVFPLIKEIRAYIKAAGDHGKTDAAIHSYPVDV